MSSIFEAIREQVTARQAAEVYGLRIGRSGRGVCPWHSDRHPDLAFYGDHCYCHACHNGGDSVALAAQLFNLSMIDAARKINADFCLKLDLNGGDVDLTEHYRRKREQEQRRQRQQAEWNALAEIVREADRRLAQYGDERAWDDPNFVKTLEARSRADLALDVRWQEVTDRERTG